jgi:hypothetical protein
MIFVSYRKFPKKLNITWHLSMFTRCFVICMCYTQVYENLNLFFQSGLKYLLNEFIYLCITADRCAILIVSFVEKTALFVMNHLCSFVTISRIYFNNSISGISLLCHLFFESIILLMSYGLAIKSY